MTVNPLFRATALGLACGGRAAVGPATVALTARPRPRWAPLVGVVALGELVADQLPQAPSRLEPLGLGARVVSGAVSGGLLARRQSGPMLVAAVLAGAAAAGGAHAGAVWRAWALVRLGRDTPGALVEDVLVLGLAAAAARG